ncbi:hypothetical protein [Martelella soudanensis]|uniref:hypothetical protein n=1 Tax=unclassified Martelella TaxID=2629616 RepID=UPI0015DDDD77|nr:MULTISPECIES: hypothetical protein [unclassified Martelella]
MTTPKLNMRISLGNILTALVFIVTIVGGYYAVKNNGEANQEDIREIKVSIRELQQDSSTKAETQALQSRVSRMEEYRDDTVDRLARIEEQMKGFKDQTQELNASIRQLISTLQPSR